MQLIFDAITTVLFGYLAFTNFLAVHISNFISVDTGVETIAVIESASLTTLPANYSIPTILLRSAAYQQAAVGQSETADFITTNNPMTAIVNIYCTSITDRQIRTTTGTGFFVHPSGVIMTNAHVAQFLLLEKSGVFGDTNCIIRNGNPAAPRFYAELLYIPPAWVEANAALIDDKAPSGTGERDYALLFVTRSMDNEPLPAIFPALPLATELLPRSMTEATVLAAGYPAGALLSGGTDTDLLPRQASTTISELYTFTSNYADVFALRGSSMGEQGASGGPIVNAGGAVIGMITTRGNDARDGVGSLRAITTSHINRTITEETGFSLIGNISGNIPYRAQVFTTTMAPFLTELLVKEAE
jgi:S1-C subfamily serine protease